MPLRTRVSLVAALLSFAACNGDSKPEASASKSTEAPAQPAKSAAKAPPADDEATSLAAKPTQRVMLEGLGLSIEVPEGTTVTPPRDADESKRRVNLKQGDFMVNLFAVDEFSTPDFAKAKEVYKSDKLVAWIRSEETPTGWITFKEVVSGMYDANRFEVGVRTVVSGKKWDCSISAKSKPLAELALAACQTLSTTDAEQTTPAAATTTPTTPVAKPTAKPASKNGKPPVQGAVTKEAMGKIVHRDFGKLRACYERALVKNPDLRVTVMTAFEIDANGKVTTASSTGADAQLSGCIAAVFKGMQFPAPIGGGNVRVNYPIRFEPAS
ncbi:MAG TPA: AgmX/PglI C-terminal domain-containing protein [Kofleriaceae bacterium]|nr:AgmX/PglI C-terminal domain-containing protein [Kofleriaceae bacterium]